jgi:DNA-binding transcriptional regulator YhcF (GntR family)
LLFDRLDPRLPTPLYAQIADRIRVAVASAELAVGDALPSVRVLAAKLRVNPATVVQAYRDLEQEGLVETRQGAGSFIAEISSDRRARSRSAIARKLVRDLLREAARQGLNAEDIRRAFDDESGGRK